MSGPNSHYPFRPRLKTSMLVLLLYVPLASVFFLWFVGHITVVNRGSHVIPRVAHFYWGGSKLSLLHLVSMQSFRALHPDWAMIVHQPLYVFNGSPQWRSGEQGGNLQGPDFFNQLVELKVQMNQVDFSKIAFFNNVSEVHKSDFIRYHLMATVGGVWLDSDILFLRSIDDVILNKHPEVDTVVCFNKNHFPVGVFMSSPGNAFFQVLVEASKARYNPLSYQVIGAHLLALLFKDNVTLMENLFPAQRFFVMNDSHYLPYAWNELSSLFVKDTAKPSLFNAFGIHWFNGAAISKKFQSDLTHGSIPRWSALYPHLNTYIDAILRSKGWDEIKCKEDLCSFRAF